MPHPLLDSPLAHHRAILQASAEQEGGEGWGCEEEEEEEVEKGGGIFGRWKRGGKEEEEQ